MSDATNETSGADVSPSPAPQPPTRCPHCPTPPGVTCTGEAGHVAHCLNMARDPDTWGPIVAGQSRALRLPRPTGGGAAAAHAGRPDPGAMRDATHRPTPRGEYRRKRRRSTGPPIPPTEPAPPPARRVLIRMYAMSLNGYGQIAEWLGRGLESLGIPVAFLPIVRNERDSPLPEFVRDRLVTDATIPPDCGDWCLQLATPQQSMPPGRAVVSFSMWETTGLPGGAAESLNRARMVLVPCRWNARTFRDAGVTRPIRAVPLGAAAAEGYRDDGTPAPRSTFRVGMAARMGHGGIRKGLNEGVAAFLEAFPDDGRHGDAVLELKVFRECLAHLTAPPHPRVIVNTAPMQPPEMAAWYRGLNVLFVPSKGEGWGLHTHQALACGRPVVAALATGTADIAGRDCCLPLDYRWEPSREFYAGPDSFWAAPTHGSMVDRLGESYEDWRAGGERLAAMGRAGAERAGRMTWDATAARLWDALVDVGMIEPAAEPIRRLGADAGFHVPATQPWEAPTWRPNPASLADDARVVMSLTDEQRRAIDACKAKIRRQACCGSTVEICDAPGWTFRGKRATAATCARCQLAGGPK